MCANAGNVSFTSAPPALYPCVSIPRTPRPRTPRPRVHRSPALRPRHLLREVLPRRTHSAPPPPTTEQRAPRPPLAPRPHEQAYTHTTHRPASAVYTCRTGGLPARQTITGIHTPPFYYAQRAVSDNLRIGGLFTTATRDSSSDDSSSDDSGTDSGFGRRRHTTPCCWCSQGRRGSASEIDEAFLEKHRDEGFLPNQDPAAALQRCALSGRRPREPRPPGGRAHYHQACISARAGEEFKPEASNGAVENMEDPSRAHGARAGHMPTGCTLHLARRRLGVVLVGGDGARNSRHRGANFSWLPRARQRQSARAGRRDAAGCAGGITCR